MVGENDVKILFIYSIDELFPVMNRYQIKLNKGWYRAFALLMYHSFYFF